MVKESALFQLCAAAAITLTLSAASALGSLEDDDVRNFDLRVPLSTGSY